VGKYIRVAGTGCAKNSSHTVAAAMLTAVRNEVMDAAEVIERTHRGMPRIRDSWGRAVVTISCLPNQRQHDACPIRACAAKILAGFRRTTSQ